MNLYKIVLQGFKSFADRTEINFDSGVTAIVGPNGCGKSNVVDAVRWVIGEQKPTELRISKSTDLIFNGTASRGSHSYCEVSLYLDNSKRIFPIEFDDLVITRKLDRSGDSSSSYINGQKVPLKDVVNLFRDTGAGKEGYSIIGQGKITALMDSKPTERRLVFEEAAGITKIRNEKEDTERKLGRTRDNMSRLNDIMQEIESNLGPLEEEAKQAIKMKGLKENLKEEEIALYLYQCENSEEAKVAAESELKKVEELLNQKKHSLEDLRTKHDNTLAERDNIDKRSDELNQEITNLLLASEKAKNEFNLLSVQLQHANEAMDRNRAKTDSNTILMKDISRSAIGATEDKSVLEKNIIEIKEQLSILEKDYSDLEKSVSQQEDAIALSQELLVANADKRGEINTLVAQYQIELKLLEDDVKDLRKELSILDNAKALIATDLNKCQAENKTLLDEQQTKIKEKERISIKIAENQSDLKAFNDKKDQLSKEIDSITFKIESTKEMVESYNNYDFAVQGLMAKKQTDEKVKESIIGTFAEIINVPDVYVIAIEVALGNALQNIVTTDEYATSYLIDVLKKNNLGRATFLPLTTVKANPLPAQYNGVFSENGVLGCATELIQYESRFSAIVSSFLGRTIIVENKDIALNVARKFNYGFRIITLEGEAFLPSGAISGGSIKSKSSRFLSAESDLEKFEKKLAKLEKDHNEIQLVIDDYNAETEDLQKHLKVVEARCFQLEKDLIANKSNIDNFELNINDKDKEMFGLSNDLIQKNNRINELTTLLKSTKESSIFAQNEKITADDYINDAKDKLVKDREQKNKLASELSNLKESYASLNASIMNFEQSIRTNNERYSSIENEQIELKVEYTKLNAEIESLQNKINKRKLVDIDQEKLDQLNAERSALGVRKNEISTILQNIQTEQSDLNAQQLVLSEKKAKEESNLEKIMLELSNTANRISETYGYDELAAKEYWQVAEKPAIKKEYDIQKALERIARVRRSIEKLGLVNELAEEKFIQENERYEKMVEQFDDLSKAETDLVNIITDLTKEMEVKFIDTFKKINDNFKTTFAELFGGGTAVLRLEQGVSALTAGIEIQAQPPGKKLLSLAPLSGGERALTAIALLFAITKLNPMPFSFLDEIDSALDEANARLFAQYLNKFSDVSQFVVVTHRKATMALCDTLYGFTMQEKGVSKMVKVKLEEAAKQIEEAEKREKKKQGDAV
ncbi:MAG TPA: chromosome segregation protein SMC [Clostridia bacterium]|nr:chromosome segregation protein SMC [Clostridia bacterium]